MTATPEIHYRAWGDGAPVLALHGLGLESSSFTGLAYGVVERGCTMIAADLPGFGLTPLPDGPLTPTALARPVVELARTLDSKPLVMGMSLGGRVALEAALMEPELFRGVVMLAPPLPRREHRFLLQPLRLLNPGIAERLPVHRAWPQMKRLADRMEDNLTGDVAHDWNLRASKRAIYYASCPATRRALISATRELLLAPAFGPEGLWQRLDALSIPAAFVWGDKDKLVAPKYVGEVAQAVPGAFQLRVPCAGHFSNGPHFRCMEAAALDAIALVEGEVGRQRPSRKVRNRVAPCVVDDSGVPHGADASRSLAPAV